MCFSDDCKRLTWTRENGARREDGSGGFAGENFVSELRLVAKARELIRGECGGSCCSLLPLLIPQMKVSR